MAQPTIAEEITRLEAELATIRNAISKQQNYASLEEGSANGRFRTDFTKANDLYARETAISTRLQTLYTYQARRA